MDLTPSNEQNVALRACADWLRQGYQEKRPIYYIAGYAGVGKTTIARILAQEVEKAYFAAYTGKAAYVLRSKGCEGATTIHSLIYKPAGETKSEAVEKAEMKVMDLMMRKPRDEEAVARAIEERDQLIRGEKRRPLFTLNDVSVLHGADLLIVDECSMVDDQMGMDLLKFRVPIIVLGDPMQLPPVGAGGFLTNRKPDQLLTEIHRHARESGILRLATDVRTNGYFDRTPGHYGADCVVGWRTGADSDTRRVLDDLQRRVLDADQLLVGLNATRHVSNARYRELMQRGPGLTPVAGDKLVCLRNNHKEGLLNGSLWRVHESAEFVDTQTVQMVISSEEDGLTGIDVSAWSHHFYAKEDDLKLKKWNRRDYNEFDFGYALTVHKSQGSQWDDVVLFDESGAFRNDRNRWLYTGVTRAAKNLTVVLG